MVRFGGDRRGFVGVGAVGEIFGVCRQARIEGTPTDGLVRVCRIRPAGRSPRPRVSDDGLGRAAARQSLRLSPRTSAGHAMPATCSNGSAGRRRPPGEVDLWTGRHETIFRDTTVIKLRVKGSWVQIPPSRQIREGRTDGISPGQRPFFVPSTRLGPDHTTRSRGPSGDRRAMRCALTASPASSIARRSGCR